MSAQRQGRHTRTLAVISGKGGSGKTMISVAMAQALSQAGQTVLLVDADAGTGGLSYYLGFSAFSRARQGLTEFAAQNFPYIISPNISYAKVETIRANSAFEHISLLSIGQHRLLEDRRILEVNVFAALLEHVDGDFDFVIYDCRGGIDEESLAVCRAVESVVLVAETDAASIQASQYLVDVMQKHALGRSLVGFMLNKAMDDPTSLAKAGNSFFNSEFLGAVPFDIEATRAFIRGEVPAMASLFSRHVASCVHQLYPETYQNEPIGLLSSTEYSTLTLRDPGLRMGALLIFSIGLYGFVGFAAAYFSHQFRFSSLTPIWLGLGALVLLAAQSSDNFKRGIGRGFRSSMPSVIFRAISR